MTNFSKLLIGFIFSCLIYSCNSHQDLEIKKESIIDKLNVTDKKSYNSLSDIDLLITEYVNLKTEINEYVDECKKRGIEKDNSETINQINSKIENLEKIKSQMIKDKRLKEENQQREDELLQNEQQIINQNNDSLDLKIQELENAQKKKLEEYSDAKVRNQSNSKNLRYLASEYKNYNKALLLYIRHYFYVLNEQYLNSNQKNRIDWASRLCELSIQQADIDEGAF
jgi:hypothetical protein